MMTLGWVGAPSAGDEPLTLNKTGGLRGQFTYAAIAPSWAARATPRRSPALAVSPSRLVPGAGRLVEMVQASGAMFGGGRYDYATSEALLVAPPLLRPQTVFSEVFEGDRAVDRSDGLAAVHEAVTQAAGVAFFDASSVISTDGADGVHFRPKRRGGCAPR